MSYKKKKGWYFWCGRFCLEDSFICRLEPYGAGVRSPMHNKKENKMSNTAVKSPIPTLDNSPFKKDVLKGGVVVITGGATGIGYACSLAFGLHGAR